MPRVADPRPAGESPAPAGRRRWRSARATILAALAAVAAVVVIAALANRTADAPSTFVVVFGDEPATPEPLGWRSDGRLRRTWDSGSQTFDRWTLAGPPDVSYDGTRVLFAGRTASDANATLWEMTAKGRGAREIVECARGCAAPRYLPDGRIVFAAPVGANHRAEALFVSRTDGSAPDRITYGRDRDRALGVLPDGRIAFARRSSDPDGLSPDAFVVLTVQPDGTGIARASSPLPPEMALAERTWITPPSADVASAAPEALLASSPGERAVRSNLSREGMTLVAAPRPLPPVATSVVDAARETGRLLCLDTWLTTRDGRPFRREERSGHVRILDGESGAVLGEAPVASDGSFYVEVPANRMLRLQALDSTGGVVSTLHSGIWVRPNENRGCIGCHEPPTLAPDNRFPLALHAEPVRALGGRTEGSAAAMRAETPR